MRQLGQGLKLDARNIHQIKLFCGVSCQRLLRRNPNTVDRFLFIVAAALTFRCSGDEKTCIETSWPTKGGNKAVIEVDLSLIHI